MNAKAYSILVVEDERIVARDLQQTLVGMGYDAFGIASSADEALRIAGERRPDVVLMDIRIKGQRDGVETARELRREHGIPVIFLSAHADEATIERAKQIEPHGYLLKPVKAAELRSAIEVSIFRHGLEQKLRRRERWFSATLNSIADPVMAVDPDGTVSFANPAAQALGGALLGALFVDEGATPLAPERTPVARALAGETVADVELFVRAPDGEGRWLNVNANPARDPDGTILGVVTVGRDVTELRRAVEALRQAATRDELTGLLNRRGWIDHATRAVHLTNRTSRPLALIYVDLNGMKAINDQLGHAAGDRALVETAELLRRTFRASDLVARFGGDEFVVLAPEHADDPQGVAVRTRFAAGLSALNADPERAFRLSATLGVTVYDPQKGLRSVDDLLAEADARMYAAKIRRRIHGSQTLEPVG